MSSSMMFQELVPNAERVRKHAALAVNTAAAVGLMEVLQSNLGPVGTLKLLVGGAGQLKLTKDGLTLLQEMQIQHPTAALIARTATAQDAITGDGTTSTVLLVGALLQQSSMILHDHGGGSGGTGQHPRHITDGIDLARDACIEFLKNYSTIYYPNLIHERDILLQIARSSLLTKLDIRLVEQMSAAVVDAVQTVARVRSSDEDNEDEETKKDTIDDDDVVDDVVPRSALLEPIDLHRVEIMTMERKTSMESRFVRGLVLDHGNRHPDMPDLLKNVYILTLNVSLEYEQTETQAGFVYSTAEQREKLIENERKWLDERCKKIIELKRHVCNSVAGQGQGKEGGQEEEQKKTFCIINQKGVDPLSLDLFAKEGILCLRRAKRRNMERLTLACGGQQVLSVEDLQPECLGYAGQVSVVTYGDDKYTFIEDCPNNASSCTLLIQGPNTLTIEQIKDGVKDGLRAVKNAVEDQGLVPGSGAFEFMASQHLMENILPTITNKKQLGVKAFANALLIIPKTLIRNAGYDIQDVLLQWKDEYKTASTIKTVSVVKKATTSNDSGGETKQEEELEEQKWTIVDPTLSIGFDYKTGQCMLPMELGVWDNVRVKRQSLHLSTVLANQLLLVDEVMRAGKQMGKQAAQAAAAGE